MIVLPPIVQQIQQKLKTNGYQCYVVGGCLRDLILNRQPQDYDFATSAYPQQIMTVFSDYHCLDIGKNHGTIGVIIDGQCYEITTFRQDIGSRDHRHPQQVQLGVTLKDDLSRRDFTMNALAYDGDLIDYFGGYQDILEKRIQTVGDSEQRFEEDALRILRAIRFQAQLGFSIAPQTKVAMAKQQHLLTKLSRERITEEFYKTVMGPWANEALQQHQQLLNNVIYQMDKCDITDMVMADDFVVRLVSLYRQVPIDQFLQMLQSLKLSKLLRQQAKQLKRSQHLVVENHSSLKRLLNQLGTHGFQQWLLLQTENTQQQVMMMLQAIKNQGELIFKKDLALDGNDLKTMGVSPNLRGKLLDGVYEYVIINNIANDKAVLQQVARQLLLENNWVK